MLYLFIPLFIYLLISTVWVTFLNINLRETNEKLFILAVLSNSFRLATVWLPTNETLFFCIPLIRLLTNKSFAIHSFILEKKFIH